MCATARPVSVSISPSARHPALNANTNKLNKYYKYICTKMQNIPLICSFFTVFPKMYFQLQFALQRRHLLCLFFALILVINLLLPLEAAPHQRRRSYSLKKGSRLERHHLKSLHDWRRAYRHLGKKQHRHHHKKKPKIHRVDLEAILEQMDSVVKPRFGR